MNKIEYQNMKEVAHLLVGLFLGVFLSLLIVNAVSAITLDECLNNSNNCTVVYVNQTFNNTYIFNESHYYNVTTNYTYYNMTNITNCINCTINLTNLSYINLTNVTNYYNGTNFTPENYYIKGDVDTRINNLDTKFNNYILKSDFPNLVNATNSSSMNWSPSDSYLGISIFITFLIAAVALGLIIKAGMD